MIKDLMDERSVSWKEQDDLKKSPRRRDVKQLRKIQREKVIMDFNVLFYLGNGIGPIIKSALYVKVIFCFPKELS